MSPNSIIVFYLTFASIARGQQNECTVNLQDSSVIGSPTKTVNPNKNVCSYTNIPYASPPVGSLRFLAPQPAQHLKSPYNATRLPNWCPQSGSPPSGVQISEDCLYLNVFVPNTTSTDLPVMIWFHGGSFTSGSSDNYGPSKLLARADVILVVAHYRLGLLGFFSTGDSTVPGNNGLKDQAFSIRWVHDNIRAFGGDPKKITIFGESAGGASVVYQYISPLNRGLINGAIAQSGSALSFWTLDKNPSESGDLMARRLGCPTLWKTLMVGCLRRRSWRSIIRAQGFYGTESILKMTYAFASLTPVVEPKGTPGAFITEDPEEIMKKGNIPDAPLLIGANKHEGSFILAAMFLAKFGILGLYKNPVFMKQGIVPDILKFAGVEEPHQANRAAASSAEVAFLSGVDRTKWDESMPGLVDLITMIGYKASTQNTAEILSRRGRKVYLYSFEHHSNNTLLWNELGFSKLGRLLPVEHGIAHADDLLYLFDFPAEFSDQDQLYSDIMCDLWLNFAKSGNPTPSADSRFANWEPYNSLEEPFIKLNVTPTLQQGYRTSWHPNGFEWN